MAPATGELNLTVITLIAIAAIIGFFWLGWPKLQKFMNYQWSNITGTQKQQKNTGCC